MYLRLMQFEEQKTKDLILWLILKLIFEGHLFVHCVYWNGNTIWAE